MRDSDVVGIATEVERPDIHSPWKRLPRYFSGGTGVRVETGKVLTAAHIVNHAVQITVRLAGASNAHRARVAYIDRARDLALLDVRTDREVTRLSIDPDEIPSVGRTILLAEYDRSEGLVRWRTQDVTKVGLCSYSYSCRNLLGLSIRGPISGGHSGSPAFMDGRFVGLVFQTNDEEGDLVPANLVATFLEQARDGLPAGVPDLGLVWQKLENEDLRKYLRVPNKVDGIVVNSTVFGSSSDGAMRKNDVIVRIGSYAVAADGSIQLANGVRVPFEYAVSERRLGEPLELEIYREGQRSVISPTLKDYHALVPLPNDDTRFVMHAGLVFVPLTFDYLSQWKWDEVPPLYKSFVYHAERSAELLEVVVVAHVLPHPVNVGYQRMFGMRVVEINGRSIRSLTDVADALDAPNGQFHVIQVDNPNPRIEDAGTSEYGGTLVLDVAHAAAATTDLARAHGMAEPRQSRTGMSTG